MKRFLPFILIFISSTSLLLLLGCEGTERYDESPALTSDFSEKVDSYINAYVANNQFNGNLLIAKGDSMLYSKSFGLANREFEIVNTDSTKFLIGSITKPFTAFGILLLEQKGMLSLDDRLSQYYPDFPKAASITIKQLLMHTSGITDYHAFESWKDDGKLDLTPKHTISTLLEKPSIFEPGERFSYSNSGYIFLGLIIEQVTGQTFEQFIQNEILEPIGLRQSGIASNTQVIADLASGYTSTPRETLKAEYINYAQPYASGNMYSTPTDLWKFTSAVLNSSYLPVQKTNEIFNSSIVYGYGWGIRDYDGLKAYGHYGAMNGFVGSITYIPEGEFFICFLTNDDNTPEHTITEDLIGILSGKSIEPPKRTQLIPLSEKMKTRVVGDYLIKKRDTLNVFVANNRLFLQETGQSRHELFPIDSLEFFLVLFEFNVAFSEPIHQYSDSLRFTGKSKLVANRITATSKARRHSEEDK